MQPCILRSVMNGLNRPLELARALADPLRLALLDRLMQGPASVAELISLAQASQPNVSNHLRILRERKLVRSRRAGRQVTYELASPDVAELLEVLLSSGRPPKPGLPQTDPLLLARSCYDHIAGRVGVEIFEALVAEDALSLSGSSQKFVRLGERGEVVLARLGVDLEAALQSRRKFAYPCLDWTERRHHLGGSLGAALLAALRQRRWVRRSRGWGRALEVTKAGRVGLRREFGLVLPGARHSSHRKESPTARA
jgi:DNA-binding transcriptional ArsR family regulator